MFGCILFWRLEQKGEGRIAPLQGSATVSLCYTDTPENSCVGVGHRVQHRYISDTYRRSIDDLNV